MLHFAMTAGDEDSKKGPPRFSGERGDFIAWFMSISAYVAWKLTSAAPILEKTRLRPPDPPAPLSGHADPKPSDPPAPVLDSNNAVTNQAEINAAAAALQAWNASPTLPT